MSVAVTTRYGQANQIALFQEDDPLLSPSFLENAEEQLEELQREVYVLTQAQRARSAQPSRSVPRRKMHRRILDEMEIDSQMKKYAINVDREKARAMSVKSNNTIIERLMKEDADVQQISTLIEDRRKYVDLDQAMPTSHRAKTLRASIAQLENKTDMARRKLNMTVARNQSLRQNIEHLNMERQVLQNLAHKMAVQLCKKREAVKMLHKEMNIHRQKRQSLEQEVSALKVTSTVQDSKFRQDWDKMTNLVQRHRALELDIVQLQGSMIYGQEQQESGTCLHQMVSKVSWQFAKEKAAVRDAQDKLDSVERTVSTLKRETNISDIDALVSALEDAEHMNFKQFRMVHRLSNQQKALENEISQANFEVNDDMEVEGEWTKKRKHERVMEQLRQKVMDAQNQLEQKSLEYEKLCNEISSMEKPIKAIFDIVGLFSPRKKSFFDASGLMESNLEHLLQEVEEVSHQILKSVEKKNEQKHGLPDRKRKDLVRTGVRPLTSKPTNRRRMSRPRTAFMPPRDRSEYLASRDSSYQIFIHPPTCSSDYEDSDDGMLLQQR